MATGAQTQGIGATMPNTYLALYTGKGDTLRGTYNALYNRLLTTDGGQTASQILEYLGLASDTILQVFLLLIEKNGQNCIEAIHRPSKFGSGLEPSTHDNRVYGFWGDIQPGRYIEMVELTEELFQPLPPVTVRTVAETQIAINLTTAQQTYLPPLEVDEQGVELQVRPLQAVPYAYLDLVMGRSHKPTQLWRELYGAIETDGKGNELKPLVEWLQVAVSEMTLPDDTPGVPPVHLGSDNTAFPPWRSAALQQHRDQILRQDFAHWYQPPGNTNLDNATLFTLLNSQREADNQQRSAERQAERELREKEKIKKVSDTFPAAVENFLQLANCDDEDDLPPLYKALANSKKGEQRLTVEMTAHSRIREEESAGVRKLLITADLLATIKSGELGDLLKLDDLATGLNPFTAGHGAGPIANTITTRLQRYDWAMEGDARPTMAELETLSTKEVIFPDKPMLFSYMVCSTSVLVDILQGNDHPHAINLRRFSKVDLPVILMSLDNRTTEDHAMQGNVYPQILRLLQTQMCTYFANLLSCRGTTIPEPEVPSYSDITHMLVSRQFQFLPALPARYIVRQTGTSGLPTGAGGGTGMGSDTGGNSGGIRGGEAVVNERPTARAWQTSFSESGKTLVEIRSHAPKMENGEDVCLSYHLKGRCWTNCARAASHKRLTGRDKTEMDRMISQHCVGGAGAETPNATGPAPAAATSRGARENAGAGTGPPAPALRGADGGGPQA